MGLTPDGALGGLAIVAESTYGTTPGTPTWVWQNYIDSTVVPKREIIQPKWATFRPATNRKYSVSYGLGEIKLAMSLADSIIGPVLAAGSAKSGSVYTFGDGSEPDTNSFSLLQNYGGGDATAANWFEYIFVGMKPTGYRFEINLDGNAVLTVPVIGRAPTKTAAGSAATPSAPAESNIVMPSDIGSVTYGGSSTAITIQGASINVDLPKTGAERRGLGESTIREPVTNGQPGVSFSVNVDLDAATGNDTIAILDEFLAGNELGDITIGDFTLSGCMLEGDPPSLQAGLMQFALTGRATNLEVTVS